MHKALLALSVALAHVAIIQSADNTQMACHLNRALQPSNNSQSLEPEYTALPQQEVHGASETDDAPIYFAAKGEPSLSGSGTIQLAENERLFYGFYAADERVATHLNNELPIRIAKFPAAQNDHFSTLQKMMHNLRTQFYDENKEVDPCNTQLQKMLISFIHLVDTRAFRYELECRDNGEFQPTLQPSYYDLNPTNKRNNYALAVPAYTSVKSSIFDLIKSNKLTRHGMLKQPQKLAQDIIRTDSNKELQALILLKGNSWLSTCKCPATTDAYKALKEAWESYQPSAVVLVHNDLEQEILMHRYDSAKKLRLFAQNLKARHQPQEYASLEEQAPFAFLDDMIALKQAEEEA